MPELQPGDIFCASNPMLFGRIVMAIERINSVDSDADYSHAGIVLGPTATTFEALWTTRRNGLFNSYAGKKVLIGRNLMMTKERYDKGWAGVSALEGRWYSVHRLFLYLLPPMSKLSIRGKYAVCGELAAMFLKYAGLLEYWSGVNPDHITDMIQHYREWVVVFEGILPATLQEFKQLPLSLIANDKEMSDADIRTEISK